jgi:DNA-binding IclR family transcriptional regulator
MSVQSIERAFVLLRAVAESPQGISVTELARRTNLHKSTVSRLIMSLEAERAIARADGTLHIGAGIAELVSPTIQPATLKTLLRPFLQELADRHNETVGLCIPDGNCALYIDQINPEHYIQVSDWTGERFPLHTVSSGKVFLAYAPDETVAGYLAQPLVGFTSHTLIDSALLRKRLGEIRAAGHDWSFEEFTEGLAVVSAPIMGLDDAVIASIYLCGPIFRFPPVGQEQQISASLKECCQRVHQLIIGQVLDHEHLHEGSQTPARK